MSPEARCDLPWSTLLAAIDFLAVQLISLWMHPHFCYQSYLKLQFADIGQVWINSSGGFFRGVLLLLLFLLLWLGFLSFITKCGIFAGGLGDRRNQHL